MTKRLELPALIETPPDGEWIPIQEATRAQVAGALEIQLSRELRDMRRVRKLREILRRLGDDPRTVGEVYGLGQA